MYEAKSLLDIKMPTLSREEFIALRASGVKTTLASLYEPEHAPKGTRFVMVDHGGGIRRPWRIWA